MDLKNRVIVVTGAASGIGKALVERFAKEAPKHVVAADLVPGPGIVPCDVSREEDIQRVIRETEAAHGPIDLFVSNAGILPINPSFEDAASSPDADWQAIKLEHSVVERDMRIETGARSRHHIAGNGL